MSFVWPSAEQLGIPHIGPSIPAPKGKILSWIRGVNVKAADYFIVKADTTLKYFVKDFGGDPARVIVSHLHGDEEVINGLWNVNTFLRRIQRWRELGIKKVTSPTFSTWGMLPLIERYSAIYRQAVVANDIIKAGFELVPIIYWQLEPINKVIVDMYGPREFIIIDLCHLRKGDDFGDYIFKHGLSYVLKGIKPKTIWVYYNSIRAREKWRILYGEPTAFIPAMTIMMSEMGKQIKKYRKTLVSADRESVLSGGGVEEMPAEKD